MPTHFPGEADEVRALDTLIKLSRAVESLHARLAQGLAGSGLTMGQLAVLEALWHLGPMNQRQLAGKLLRSPANITTVLDNLERDGLARRERGRDDRRCVTIRLTPEGERRIAEVFPAHVSRITSAMSALTPDEQEQLGRLCRTLGLAVAAGSGPWESSGDSPRAASPLKASD